MPTFRMPHADDVQAPNLAQARAKFWTQWAKLISQGKSPPIKFFEAERQIEEVAS